MVNTENLAIQRVFKVDAFDLETGELLTRLEALKNSTFSNNGQIVYAQGGDGNPKIVGFSHSKEASLELSNALITAGAMGIQTGTGVATLTNATDIPVDEVYTISTADTLVMNFTANGTVGSELGFVYMLDGSGHVSKTFTQTTGTATTGTFTYASASKTISFYEGDVPAGSQILTISYPTVSSASQITSYTDVFASSVKLHCRAIFRDACTNEDYAGVLVIYKAKCSEEWSWDLTADGDPATQNMTFEALKSCSSSALWDIFLYDAADLT